MGHSVIMAGLSPCSSKTSDADAPLITRCNKVYTYNTFWYHKVKINENK